MIDVNLMKKERIEKKMILTTFYNYLEGQKKERMEFIRQS